MAGLISAFDIVLQPGVNAYASPLKTYEYMALGRAIVAPETPNMREILSQDGTALLFDPDSTAAFEQAIERLAGDPALRASLGAAARAAIVDRDLHLGKHRAQGRRARQAVGECGNGRSARSRTSMARYPISGLRPF